MTNALELDYYYIGNQLDPLINLIGDCFTKNIYFILKQNTKFKNLYKAYIDDFSLYISTDIDGNIMSIYNKNHFIKDLYIKNDSFEIKGLLNNAYKHLENLLNKGEIVFTNTIMCKLPFYKTFTLENIDYDNFHGNHWFLIIGHSKNSLFIVEDPINIINYTPIKQNRSVYEVKKECFEESFKHYVRFHTYRPNIEAIARINDQAHLWIDRIIESYYYTEADNIYSGRASLEKLINICERGNVSLNDYLYWVNPKTNFKRKEAILYNKLIFNISLCCNKKKLMLIMIESSNKDTNLEKLKLTLKNNIDTWTIIKNLFIREFYRQNYYIDNRFVKYFTIIIKSEDRLYELIKRNREELIMCFKTNNIMSP
jgi:hypothetical protein